MEEDKLKAFLRLTGNHQKVSARRPPGLHIYCVLKSLDEAWLLLLSDCFIKPFGLCRLTCRLLLLKKLLSCLLSVMLHSVSGEEQTDPDASSS